MLTNCRIVYSEYLLVLELKLSWQGVTGAPRHDSFSLTQSTSTINVFNVEMKGFLKASDTCYCLRNYQMVSLWSLVWLPLLRLLYILLPITSSLSTITLWENIMDCNKEFDCFHMKYWSLSNVMLCIQQVSFVRLSYLSLFTLSSSFVAICWQNCYLSVWVSHWAVTSRLTCSFNSV